MSDKAAKRYLVLHVGARTSYSACGGPFIDVAPTSAKMIGMADRRPSAEKIAFGYWANEDCGLGSMTEHLVIVDTRPKQKRGDKIDKKFGWYETNVLTNKMCEKFNRRLEKIRDKEERREERREEAEQRKYWAREAKRQKAELTTIRVTAERTKAS